eukprot:2723130-Amphidinium_carterae.1
MYRAERTRCLSQSLHHAHSVLHAMKVHKNGALRHLHDSPMCRARQDVLGSVLGHDSRQLRQHSIRVIPMRIQLYRRSYRDDVSPFASGQGRIEVAFS